MPSSPIRRIISSALGVATFSRGAPLTPRGHDWTTAVLQRVGVIGVAIVATLGMGAAPAHAIGDGVIAATDAGDNVGRLVVDLGDGRTALCTATLTAPDEAMTAEHCVWGAKSWQDITVTFGTRNIDSDPGESARVVSCRKSSRDYRGTRDSIVILKLERAIPGITPARVAKPGVSNKLYAKGVDVYAVGWGTINRGQDIRSAELRIAVLEVADPIATLNGGAIRVAETGGGRPQHGDSGGPLFSDDGSGPIVVGVYTGSGIYEGSQHFYMKTSIDPLFK